MKLSKEILRNADMSAYKRELEERRGERERERAGTRIERGESVFVPKNK